MDPGGSRGSWLPGSVASTALKDVSSSTHRVKTATEKAKLDEELGGGSELSLGRPSNDDDLGGDADWALSLASDQQHSKA
uniref:Uncharacterized protein n=1 Tax=Oryza glumipatula TaxID=40148 RepID=A0A0E0B0K5_9ORYZ